MTLTRRGSATVRDAPTPSLSAEDPRIAEPRLDQLDLELVVTHVRDVGEVRDDEHLVEAVAQPA